MPITTVTSLQAGESRQGEETADRESTPIRTPSRSACRDLARWPPPDGFPPRSQVPSPFSARVHGRSVVRTRSPTTSLRRPRRKYDARWRAAPPPERRTPSNSSRASSRSPAAAGPGPAHSDLRPAGHAVGRVHTSACAPKNSGRACSPSTARAASTTHGPRAMGIPVRRSTSRNSSSTPRGDQFGRHGKPFVRPCHGEPGRLTRQTALPAIRPAKRRGIPDCGRPGTMPRPFYDAAE